MIYILSITLRTLNYGNYGIFLVMGNAGFVSSTVVHADARRIGHRPHCSPNMVSSPFLGPQYSTAPV